MLRISNWLLVCSKDLVYRLAALLVSGCVGIRTQIPSQGWASALSLAKAYKILKVSWRRRGEDPHIHGPAYVVGPGNSAMGKHSVSCGSRLCGRTNVSSVLFLEWGTRA